MGLIRSAKRSRRNNTRRKVLRDKSKTRTKKRRVYKGGAKYSSKRSKNTNKKSIKRQLSHSRQMKHRLSYSGGKPGTKGGLDSNYTPYNLDDSSIDEILQEIGDKEIILNIQGVDDDKSVKHLGILALTVGSKGGTEHVDYVQVFTRPKTNGKGNKYRFRVIHPLYHTQIKVVLWLMMVLTV